jgi:hypothetical protein
MRAILRATDPFSSNLWVESGERFELPELTDPAVHLARAAAAASKRQKPAPPKPGPKPASVHPEPRPSTPSVAPSRVAGPPNVHDRANVDDRASVDDREPTAPRTQPRAPVTQPPAQPSAKALLEPTGPTDEGGPGAVARVHAERARLARDHRQLPDDLSDLATDEVSRGALLRIVKAPPVFAVPGIAPDSLPPLSGRDRERALAEARVPSGISRQFARIDDEMSTGLFEPMGWDEADPCSAVHDSEPAPEPPVERARPHLSVVQSAQVEEDFSGIVALPLPTPPRPRTAEVQLPSMRRAAAVPDWYDPDHNVTGVVLDPLRAGRAGTGARWTFWSCVAADLAAWAAGFVVTFAVGGFATVTAVGVAVVIA